MEPDPVLSFDEFRAYYKTRKSVPRYDSSVEPKPDLLWWRLDKVSLDVELKQFSETIVNLLKDCPAGDTELEHLFLTAPNLRHVLRSAAVKVALVAMQGTGKSLSTNAIFDREGLSITGAKGVACTSAVIRYTHLPGGDTSYHAHIKFLDDDKREAMLKEHARNYYFYHNADDDEDDEDGDAGREQADQKSSQTAEAVFKIIFGSMDAFLASWSAPTFKSGEFVTLCLFKCKDALKKHGVSSGNTLFKDADQPRDLMKQLKPFVTALEGEASFAPLVDHVTISFSHELLEAGIEFIDLPGWGDINQSRARHAENVKDTVDAQILLADTGRVADDRAFLDRVRGAIAHHGSTSVKVVATKIDQLSDTDLKEEDNPEVEKIKAMIKEVEEELENTDEEDDDENNEEEGKAAQEKKRDSKDLETYVIYLQRCVRQTMIATRSADINIQLAEKLKDRTHPKLPELFHTSPSEYLNWLSKPKISFKGRPTLSPDMTGLPALRRSLYALPAEQNLKDYERHIDITIPAWLEKLKRTVSSTERDGGFRTLADEFDVVRTAFMTQMLKQAISAFKGCSQDGLDKMKVDIITFKEQVSELIDLDWTKNYNGKAWETILKRRGTILPGMSQARALRSGLDWNHDLARILRPGFYKWSETHTRCMEIMEQALLRGIDQLYHKVNMMMDGSTVHIVIVDKTKRKWAPLRYTLQVKMKTLMKNARKLEKETLTWATQEYERNNNLIAAVTDNIFAEVLLSEPERKEPTTNKQGKVVARYVTPKIQYQKKQMERLMLDPTNHLVDQINRHFRTHFDDRMRKLLEHHFAQLDEVLQQFSEDLGGEAPITYHVTKVGHAIRADVREQIHNLEAMVKSLHDKLPISVKQEDKPNFETVDSYGGAEERRNLADIYEQISRKKKAERPLPKGRNKRIKQEYRA